MAFPSTLSSFPRPTTSDKLNNPSHSGLHNTVSSALGQVEAVIGVDGANSVLGTIIGDLRSPGSGGGGHVQAANKGGTGQTAYTKGDILVAQSSSVLTKLAVGSDGLTLKANSSVAAGIEWGSGAGNKINNVGSTLWLANSSTLTSIAYGTIPGSTLGTSGAVRARVFVSNWLNNGNADEAYIFKANYGSSSIFTLVIGSLFAAGTGQASLLGNMELELISEGYNNRQKAIFQGNFTQFTSNPLKNDYQAGAPLGSVKTLIWNKSYSSVAALNQDSGGDKAINITVQQTIAREQTGMVIEGFTIEKIT